jgi:NAD(P)-dependent dehydrogenase (short-subunit alcohol dehydrogenase family)
MVTAATSGLGLATVRQLAAPGATVIVVGRNAARCTAVAESISGASDANAPQSRQQPAGTPPLRRACGRCRKGSRALEVPPAERFPERSGRKRLEVSSG